MEFYKMGGLSTAHISEKTYDGLYEGKFGPYAVEYDFGLFVAVPDSEEDEKPCPHDLSVVMEYARKNCVNWIKFDSDALIDQKLPSYAWTGGEEELTVEEVIKQKGWFLECEMIMDCASMDVRVSFIRQPDDDPEETGFTIKPFDAKELQELFEEFCAENGYVCNLVESVSVTAVYSET